MIKQYVFYTRPFSFIAAVYVRRLAWQDNSESSLGKRGGDWERSLNKEGQRRSGSYRERLREIEKERDARVTEKGKRNGGAREEKQEICIYRVQPV